MSPAFFVPFLVGMLAVLQAALNRRIAAMIGLLPTVILNAGVLLGLAVVGWLVARGARDPLAGWMSGVGSFAGFGWWWLVPGVCGLSLVAGVPWAIQRVGALQTFVALVSAQMLFSLIWDHVVEHLTVSPQRCVGALLAVLGAIVVAWR
jgi:transporter family-2 protein